MNILLTCAGRRNYLVQFFAEALGKEGHVFAVDSCPNAPALQEASAGFLVPSVDAPGYVARLVGICRDHGISLLIPLNDLELPLLSAQHERFRNIGTTVLLSSSGVINTCFDKWETAKFLARSGISGPATYLNPVDAEEAICRGEVAIPLIMKPRWGSASIGIEIIEHRDDIVPAARIALKRIRRSILGNVSRQDPRASLLFQERLHGQEYGLDVVNDLSGNYLHTFVRRKLGMRAGETDRAVAVRSGELEALGKAIGKALGHVGTLDCDVFDSEGRLSVLEMNPRFGGGYPFSHMAGADLPAAIVAMAKGERPDVRSFIINPDTVVSKCDRLVAVTEEKISRY
ncbi:MAG TPA: ATP-grasp domain-containing protein [Chthoniobacteraceae bacterium]|nr:ATP-grasp domain-containing protein [Chthoniobacteraceae bacterium]